MFSPALAHYPLNPFLVLEPGERRIARARALNDAATDAASQQGYLAQFQAYWSQVVGSLDDLLALPERLQSGLADLVAARQAAIEQGQSDVADQAAALYSDVLAHESQAVSIANTIAQYRETWRQIAGAWGTVEETVAGWWSSARHAVGLQGLGVLPALPVIVSAVTALGLVVAGLAILAWWQTTAATIEGVKNKTIPASALTSSTLFGGLSQTMLVGGAVILGALLLTRR